MDELCPDARSASAKRMATAAEQPISDRKHTHMVRLLTLSKRILKQSIRVKQTRWVFRSVTAVIEDGGG